MVFKYKLKNRTFQISSCSETVEPLCFPILHPNGENGFCTSIQSEIGCMKYLCSRWLLCDNIDESILNKSNNEVVTIVTNNNESEIIKTIC